MKVLGILVFVQKSICQWSSFPSTKRTFLKDGFRGDKAHTILTRKFRDCSQSHRVTQQLPRFQNLPVIPHVPRPLCNCSHSCPKTQQSASISISRYCPFPLVRNDRVRGFWVCLSTLAHHREPGDSISFLFMVEQDPAA